MTIKIKAPLTLPLPIQKDILDNAIGKDVVYPQTFMEPYYAYRAGYTLRIVEDEP